MKKLLLLLVFVPLVSFGQSQMLNGISINGPQGFEKSGELEWKKGNDIIAVGSLGGFVAQDAWGDQCKKGSRTTEYLFSKKIKISGNEYIICFSFGENDFLIAQTLVYREGHSYIITAGTYSGDYEYSEMVEKSYEHIVYMMGYMINRIKIF